MPRIEIVGERRRAHDAGFRAIVVAETAASGARVEDVARRHGVCTSLIYRWRRAAGIGASGIPAVQLFPVRLGATPDEVPLAPETRTAPASTPRRAGLIEIELGGGVRVSVEEDVSLAALRRVMSVLRR